MTPDSVRYIAQARGIAVALLQIFVLILRVFAIILAANYSINSLATNHNKQKTDCPDGIQATAHDLHGLWRAQFDGLVQGANLLLEKHSELADSVQGSVDRSGDKTLAAGDVDQGSFTLEESADGKTIIATWQGEVIDASCSKEIQGTWTPIEGKARRFVLRKQGGW